MDGSAMRYIGNKRKERVVKDNRGMQFEKDGWMDRWIKGF